MSCRTSDIRKLCRELKDAGWSIERSGSDHIKAVHPKGGFVTMSAKPSCHRAIKNVRAQIKRLNAKHSALTLPQNCAT